MCRKKKAEGISLQVRYKVNERATDDGVREGSAGAEKTGGPNEQNPYHFYLWR